VLTRHPLAFLPFPTRRSSDLRGRATATWLRALEQQLAQPLQRVLCLAAIGVVGAALLRLAERLFVDADGLLQERPHLLVQLVPRSEEHTSELQSRGHLVCRLL